MGKGSGESGNCGQPRVKFDLLIYKSAKLFERGRCHGRRVATAAAVCFVVEGERRGRGYPVQQLQVVIIYEASSRVSIA